ncbi:MAG: hypothetical protein R3B49_07320 [Phycisphaerales bacterium]
MSAETTEVVGTPDLIEVQQHLVRPTDPVIGKVVTSELCTKGRKKAAGIVRHVAIDVSGTPLEGAFRAGQSFGVVPPGLDAHGTPHKLRLYSISAPSAGDDGQGKVLATSVKRVVEEHWEDHTLFRGVCSNYLCDLPVGAEVMVTGPAGKRFVLPKDVNQHDYVFIATGTGIAPFRAMTLDLLTAGCTSQIVLLMGSPYTTDLIYDELFRELDEKHANFHYVTAISREPQPDLPKKLYVQQRISTNADMFKPLLESDRALVYVCGIAGMEVGIFQEMKSVLSPEGFAQYVQGDDDVLADPKTWTSKMIPRQLKPTRRMRLEVYLTHPAIAP